MHTYKPHAYLVDLNGTVVQDLGIYTIVIQEYSGSALADTTNEQLWISTMQSYLEDYSSFGGSVIVADGFAGSPYLFFKEKFPGLEALYLGTGVTGNNYRIKYVFPSGDYAITRSAFNSTNAGIYCDGYDAQGNLIYQNFYLPGSINGLGDPTYDNNVPNFRCVNPTYFTSTGFADNVPNDYVPTTSRYSAWRSIKKETNNANFYKFLNRQMAEDGYLVTYSLIGCTGDSENPTRILPSATITTMRFTPDEGKWFSGPSLLISGEGYPTGPVVYTFDTASGELRIGPVTTDITIRLEAYENPYDPGGTSGPGGSEGEFDDTSDTITMPTLPSLSFADTGFCRIYNPNLQQLIDLADYMWTDTTFLSTIVNHAKQLFENPMDAIISLSMVPCTVYSGTDEVVKVMFIPTRVSMPPVTNQFVDVDCGTLTIPRYYGSALDWNPYTSIDLYLPYIGQVTLDVDEVMYRTLHCVYRVDVVTGSCVAHIKVSDDNGGESDLYQFAGHCSIEMPLSSADFSSFIGAIIGATKMIAGLAATGAGHPEIGAAILDMPAPSKTTRTDRRETNWVKTERNPKTNRQIQGGTGSIETNDTTTYTNPGASFGEMAAASGKNLVGEVVASKIQVEHSSGFTGTSGYLGVRRPFAIIKRPNHCYPENYEKYNGFPSMITMSLGSCVGYTRVQNIQLTNISATNPELSEIVELLMTGVIF